MRLILLAVTVLAFVGCGPVRTRLNHGADLAVYEASPEWFYENMPRRVGRRWFGFYDPTDGSITIDRTLSPWGKARVFSHEMTGHGVDHQNPKDGWELLARYHSPAFKLLTHSEDQLELSRDWLASYPDPVDVRRAVEAARQAQQQEAGQ